MLCKYLKYEWLHNDADNICSLIHVKSFEETCKFTTLDGAIREVPRGSLFICDCRAGDCYSCIMGK